MNLSASPRFAFLALAAVMLASSGEVPSSPKVALASGLLAGVREDHVDAYLGIPYAAAPVGENRWRSPQPVARWEGVRQAQVFGDSCWQSVAPQGFGPWTHEYVVQGKVSEDCLFLNVWAPSRPAHRLPVLVWIHGGGFDSGSGSVAIYNGRNIARTGIIVVTINYRLGVFGFLAHPELTQEAGGNSPGNFGLQDMIAALRWVRTNISAFGGDPNAVTVAGQSAGAIAVHDIIASPLAKGLFQRAIVQSGLPSTIAAVPLKEAEQAGITFMRKLGTSTLEELRALPPDRVAGNAKGFVPVVDGLLLPQLPEHAITQGRFTDVPMLVGITANEGSAMTQTYGAGDVATFKALLASNFGPLAERFSVLYPTTSDDERAWTSKRLLRDRGLAALYVWASDRLPRGCAPVYGYLFEHVEPGPKSARWLAFHSSEIPYVFRTLEASPERRFTAADRALSMRVSIYWLNFVRHGNPNGPSLPTWPKMKVADPRIIVIGERIRATRLLPQDKLQAMKTYVESGGKPNIF